MTINAANASSRIRWLDACRLFAALGVVLIHSTTDATGLPFAGRTAVERIGPIILRTIGEFSGSELFFVFSLFLLAFKADRKPQTYSQTLLGQAHRLLIPFSAWTLFYGGFRLVKAGAFGYLGNALHDLGQHQTWIDFFLLGTAQYHLHFLPTLFLIVTLSPLMGAAVRFPLIGLAVIPLISVLDGVQGYIWFQAHNAELRDYLLRIVKVACYSGYGLAAFSLFGLWKRGMSAADWRLLFNLTVGLVFIDVIAKSPYYYGIIMSGQWGVRPPSANFAHFLLPILVFGAFLATQNLNWSPRFSQAAKYTFGVYLIHPVFIDAYDICVHLLHAPLNPTAMVLSKVALVTPASFAAAWGLSQVEPLAWLIGLGPTPFGWLTSAVRRLRNPYLAAARAISPTTSR